MHQDSMHACDEEKVILIIDKCSQPETSDESFNATILPLVDASTFVSTWKAMSLLNHSKLQSECFSTIISLLLRTHRSSIHFAQLSEAFR